MDLSYFFNHLSWESILGIGALILLVFIMIKLLIIVYIVKLATNAALDEIEKRQLASRQNEKQEIFDYIDKRLAEYQQAAQSAASRPEGYNQGETPWQPINR